MTMYDPRVGNIGVREGGVPYHIRVNQDEYRIGIEIWITHPPGGQRPEHARLVERRIVRQIWKQIGMRREDECYAGAQLIGVVAGVCIIADKANDLAA